MRIKVPLLQYHRIQGEQTQYKAYALYLLGETGLAHRPGSKHLRNPYSTKRIVDLPLTAAQIDAVERRTNPNCWGEVTDANICREAWRCFDDGYYKLFPQDYKERTVQSQNETTGTR